MTLRPPDKLTVEELWTQVQSLHSQYFELFNLVQALKSTLELSFADPSTRGPVLGQLPQSPVSPETVQVLIQIPPTSDGGRLTKEAMTPKSTQTKPTDSGSAEEQDTGPTAPDWERERMRLVDRMVHLWHSWHERHPHPASEQITADEAHEKYGVPIRGSVVGHMEPTAIDDPANPHNQQQEEGSKG